MIEINITFEDDDEIGTINAYLPENWEEINVGTFQKVFSKDIMNMTNVEQTLHILTCLTNLSEDLILQLPIDTFKDLVDKIIFIFSEIPKEEIEFIEINDEKYYLYSDYEKLTTGEIISLDTILESNKNNVNKCLSDILCIFLRKKKENGKLEKFTTTLFERKDMFSKLPINKVYHLIIFFLTTKNISTPNIKDYTEDNPN
jgi:hypothetical protein